MMNRSDITLAAFAAAGEDAAFTPVQVQKLFFLIDREASHLFDGPHYCFRPYDYGPFDREVYDQLSSLSAVGSVSIDSSGRYRSYSLTEKGLNQGNFLLEGLNKDSAGYLRSISQWVRQLSFEQLVAAIYLRHPDMKVNSVFRQ